MAASSLVGNPPKRTRPTSHVKKPAPARVAKHAAKVTPVGRVAEAAGTAVAKGQQKRQESKEARTAHKARVKSQVERETAKLEASKQIIRKPRIRMLAVLYIAAILMAVLALFFAEGSYHEKMGKFFMQMTGLSALYFALALLATSERAARTTILFGALIDIVILLNITRKITPNLTKQGTPTPISQQDLPDYQGSH